MAILRNPSVGDDPEDVNTGAYPCPDCGDEVSGGGFCPACAAERNARRQRDAALDTIQHEDAMLLAHLRDRLAAIRGYRDERARLIGLEVLVEVAIEDLGKRVA